MAKIYQKPTVGVEIVVAFTESEARALDALAGYNVDTFIAAFYREMGRHYLQPHERGLREFLASVRQIVPGILSRADNAREAFEPKPKLVEQAAKGKECPKTVP